MRKETKGSASNNVDYSKVPYAARTLCKESFVLWLPKFLCRITGTLSSIIPSADRGREKKRRPSVSPYHMPRFVKSSVSHWYWHVCHLLEMLILPFAGNGTGEILTSGDFSLTNIKRYSIHESC